MRVFDIRLTSRRGLFDPFAAAAGSADVRAEAIQQVRLLGDGTALMLQEVSGSLENAERLVTEEFGPEDVECQISEGDPNVIYVHWHPGETIRQLLSLLQASGVVIDFPIRYSGSDLLLTLIGDQEVISEHVHRAPDDVEVYVERTTQYVPGGDGSETLVSQLTPFERRAVRTAVELGYYRNPREARYSDIAEELDCSGGTVGHHLRNAEAKVMGELFGAADRREEPVIRN